MQPIELAERLYEQGLRTQFWSDAQMADHQWGQIEQLLRHARGTVPFYANRLDAALDPAGRLDPSRWPDLPIVTRADLRQRRAAMQSLAPIAGHGATGVTRTSGSTGEPVQITGTTLATIVNDTLRWRLHHWHGLDWSATILNRLGDRAPGDERRLAPIGPWGAPWLPATRKGRQLQVGRYLDIAGLAAASRESHARYFINTSHLARADALEARRLGIEIAVDAVLVQGSAVLEPDRALLGAVFGARLIEQYASQEAGHMAHQCPEGRLHVNGELALVEILRPDNSPCAPGETGRVIVTPIYSTAQPLIRYEQGDMARLGTSCPCGRHGPVLEAVVGRSAALFTHPDGRVLARLLPVDAMRALGLSVWQLAQVGPLAFELRFEQLPGAPLPDSQALEALFASTYFPDAQLSLRPCTELAPGPTGKRIDYVNEYAANSKM